MGSTPKIRGEGRRVYRGRQGKRHSLTQRSDDSHSRNMPGHAPGIPIFARALAHSEEMRSTAPGASAKGNCQRVDLSSSQ
jgi:hypothetical protein